MTIFELLDKYNLLEINLCSVHGYEFLNRNCIKITMDYIDPFYVNPDSIPISSNNGTLTYEGFADYNMAQKVQLTFCAFVYTKIDIDC